jgi:MFS family permease
LPASLLRARVAVAATFVVHAFVAGTWATRVPAIKADLDLDDAELGIALTGFAVGLFLGTRLPGALVDRFGTGPPIRVGLPILCAALLGPALATDLVGLVAALGVLGFASGFLDVAMNVNAVVVEREYGRPIMSGLHGSWSAGLLAGSGVGALAAALGAGILLHFGLVAAALGPLALVATRGLLSTRPLDTSAARSGEAGWSAAVLSLGLVVFAVFACEGAAADWSAVYMDETVEVGPGLAGVAFFAFSLGMIASRFAGDRLSARCGPARVTRGGALLAAGGLALTLLAPSPAPALAGYLLYGAGFGPIVPIAFSAAGNVDRTRSGRVLGWVVTLGYLGAIVGPIVIGFVADARSLRAALLLPLGLALSAAALASSVGAAAGGARGFPRRGSGTLTVMRDDDEQKVDPTLAEREPEEEEPGVVGGGGPAATIRGGEVGGEGEGLADTEH